MKAFWKQLAIATNWPVLAAVLALSTLGVYTIWVHDPLQGRQQLLLMCVAFCCLVAFQGVNYLRIGRWAWGFYLVSLLLLVYTVAPGVPESGLFGVPNIKGARAWINLGIVHLEPAELMKIAFCMVLARYLRFRSNYRTLGGLLPPFALALAPLVLILKQPALGMAMLFLPTLFTMLFVAGAKIKHLLGVILLGMSLLPAAWLLGSNVEGVRVPLLIKPYQWKRVLAMFTHDETQDFQQDQALIALGSGGWFGKGPGHIPSGVHVPEAHNDMILALIGEQFGFFGVSLTFIMYMVLFTAGIEIAGSTREPFGRLLAVGIVAVLMSQTTLNLGVCLHLMPVTGITLPFISYGGSSLIASFMAAGLLLNVGQNRPIVMAKDSFEFE